MIFLLNRERVLVEVLELARLKISEILAVRPEQVEAKLEVEGNKLMPNFAVDIETSGALERERIQQGIAKVWLDEVRPQLVDRLQGLQEVRYEFQKESSCENSS